MIQILDTKLKRDNGRWYNISFKSLFCND